METNRASSLYTKNHNSHRKRLELEHYSSLYYFFWPYFSLKVSFVFFSTFCLKLSFEHGSDTKSPNGSKVDKENKRQEEEILLQNFLQKERAQKQRRWRYELNFFFYFLHLLFIQATF